MNKIAAVAAFALFCAVLWKVIAHFAPSFQGLFLCGAGVVFLALFFQTVAPLFSYLAELKEKTGQTALWNVVWKAAGICALVSVSASVCRDLGEERIAEKVELCGKGALLALAFPLLKEILAVMGEWTF